jgi:hypothetical protein
MVSMVFHRFLIDARHLGHQIGLPRMDEETPLGGPNTERVLLGIAARTRARSSLSSRFDKIGDKPEALQQRG